MANLTQLKLLEDLSGFLLVDKPAGIAFATVVKAVKRKFNLVKVGHGGSLDAPASGLFVLLLGDANRYADRVMGADRAYEGKVRFGLKTDTGDVHGRPAGTGPDDAVGSGHSAGTGPDDAVGSRVPRDRTPDAATLAAALPDFRGDVFQTEPPFCTIRKEGTAAYEIADTGEHKPFLAHVYRFDVEADAAAAVPSDTVRFTLRASKGVIPRALVRDLGDAVGCGASLASLRRTALGNFDVKDAIPFDRLLATAMKDFAPCVIPLAKARL